MNEDILGKKKLKKLQEELKKVELERDSKNDQIEMLKNAVKKMNKQIEGFTDELKQTDHLRDELDEAKAMYERVKMENEVLLDRSFEEPIILDTAEDTVLQMLVCQSAILESKGNK